MNDSFFCISNRKALCKFSSSSKFVCFLTAWVLSIISIRFISFCYLSVCVFVHLRIRVLFAECFEFTFVDPREARWWRWYRLRFRFRFNLIQYHSMDLIIKHTESDVMFVIGRWVIIDFILADAYTFFHFLFKFRQFLTAYQFGCILIWDFHRCIT